MTDVKTEAWNLIQHLPEEKIIQVVTFIKSMNFTIESHDDNFLLERKRAFQRLDDLNIQVPDDFDYKKELERARNEKYDYKKSDIPAVTSEEALRILFSE